jgi:hypothetical protein
VIHNWIRSTLLISLFLVWTQRVPAADPLLEPLVGPTAEVELFEHYEAASFGIGVKLYTNRAYTLEEAPDYLLGKSFARNSIDRTGFRCTKAGVVTLLTPDPADPKAATLYKELEAAGFTRIGPDYVFQLFGEAKYDLVRVYQKELEEGEEYRLAKWAVLVGAAKMTRWRAEPVDPPNPWPANDGEVLHNGIQLPKVWPPRHLDPYENEPMEVPYLEHPPEVVSIDVGRQLLVDDFLIESTDLERRFHKAQKYEGNPVLEPETKLELNGERDGIACPKSGGVWWDPELKRFRMWYEAGWIHTICYATSRDGLHWDRPDLDIEPGTNRILDPALTPDSWAVFPNYEGDDPDECWKMYMRPPGGYMPGLSMVSADGVHWSKPIESGITGDRSTMFYNPFRKKWVYSLRSGVRGRSRHYWEADDFLEGAEWHDFNTHADEKTPVFWAAADRLDPPDPEIGQAAQLYNLDAVAYESIMLGIYQIHLGPPNEVGIKTGLPKITELNLAYSRDGFHWDRPDREAFIPATRRDTWDRGYVQSVGGLCTVRGDKLWFYYIGFQGDKNRLDPHWMKNGMYDRGSTGIAFLRRDGFASMDAGSDGGTLTTRPVRFSGEHLFVNVDCPDGKLLVEVLDEQNQPIEPFTFDCCEPVSIDSTLTQITWKDAPGLAALKGKPVRLRFHLTSGSLYSFWVSPSTDGRSNGYLAGGGPGYPELRDTVGQKGLEAGKAFGD